MLPEPRNDLASADDQPGLCRPEQLIATKRNHVDPALDDLAHDWFINDSVLPQISELARTSVFIQRQPLVTRQRRQLRTFRHTRETHDAIVGWVHTHDEPRVLIDGLLVVPQVSTVRCADLDH